MPHALLRRLVARSQFLAVAATRRKCARAGVVLQIRTRNDGDPAIGVGFTATKKVGNAVVRNRARRRLREAARAVLPRLGVAGSDYVAIARAETGETPFLELIAAFEDAANQLSRSDGAPR
jgi:ribonuclease P protein component